MGNMIWRIGNSLDEIACAKALHQKNNAEVVTTETVQSFSGISHLDRLQIVADFSLIKGTASNLTAQFIAELLIEFGLQNARTISLVICNSAVPCPALGGKTFVEKLRESLIAEAVKEKKTLCIGTISGRKGYVNVYNQVIQESEWDGLVREHFMASMRTPEVGRKYVYTEPTLRSPDNQFVPKGKNKSCSEGIAVLEGVKVA